MGLQVQCDFCGTKIAEFGIKESWEIQKYREAEKICCDECEKTWEDYEKEVRQLETTFREDLEEAKARLRNRYFNKGEEPEEETPGQVRMERMGEDTEKKPRHAFRTKTVWDEP